MGAGNNQELQNIHQELSGETGDLWKCSWAAPLHEEMELSAKCEAHESLRGLEYGLDE